MASFELLIRIDNRPEDLIGLTQYGDVVAAFPAGWDWSERERTSPNWMIIELDITQAEVDALVSPERDVFGVKTKKYRRQRIADFDSAPGLKQRIENHPPRTVNNYKIKYTPAERNKFRSVIVHKGNADNL